MKKCFKCENMKELNMFYNHGEMSDGHLNKCKECTKSDVRKNYSENIEKYTEYEKKRMNLPHRIKARYEYSQTERGKIALRKGNKSWCERFPKKRYANGLVKRAILSGNLTKPKECSSCMKNSDIEAHHSDYSKPLDVIWFCIKCHKEWHRNNKAIYPF